MAVKEQLLSLLENDRGVYVSGEALAGALGVSRAAVWKAMRALQEEGYPIDGVTNKGYRLSTDADILSVRGVEKYLSPAEAQRLSMEAYQTVGSTNTLLREKADAPEGTVILAAGQTAGKGRRGRGFYSPPDTGLYMSVLLRPELAAAEAASVTAMAAVAMCEAMESVAAVKPQIKWVNDIFLNGKKVCGILTEAELDMETGNIGRAVLGAGVNVYPPKGGFPPALGGVAGSLLATRGADVRNRLAAAFLHCFFLHYDAPAPDYISGYQQRSLATGKRVTVLFPEGDRPALALGVDAACRLLVRYDDGEEAALSSGEISVRL